MVAYGAIIGSMNASRLMNTLIALALVLGQFAGGVHLASHAEPVHIAQSAHMHTDGPNGKLHDPQGKLHEKSECAACHLATNLLAVTAARFTVPVDSSAGLQSAPCASTSTTAAFMAAYAIRGPPVVS